MVEAEGSLLGWTYDKNPPQSISYAYDALARRVNRTEVSGTAWRPQTTETRYRYQGLLPTIASEFTVREGYDDDDEAWERSINDRSYTVIGTQILSHVDGLRQTAVVHYHQDVRRSTIALSDERGRVDAEYRYSAYGVVYRAKPGVGSAAGARPRGTDYLYSQSRLDSQTRLADYGYRDYAPEIAWFTTVDPIRDGRNWMMFVDREPVNRVDVWGLESAEDGKGAFTSGLPTADIPAPENELMNMFNEALAANSDFFADRSVCDEFVEAILDSMDRKPDDWPDSRTTTVGLPPPATGVNYIEFYEDKTTNALPDNALVVIMMEGGTEEREHMIIFATDAGGYGTGAHFSRPVGGWIPPGSSHRLRFSERS